MTVHPLLTAMLKTRAQRKLVGMGYKRSDVKSVVDPVDDETIQALYDASAPADTITTTTQAAPNSHPILAWIAAFLGSPAGQALEAALIQFLLHALGI